MAEPTLLLFDTASVYFRAFYALPKTMRAPDGTPVNAVRGLLDTISRLVVEYSPSQLACCWDNSWRPLWRVALVPSYKAQRVGAEGAEQIPDELAVQIPLIGRALELLSIPVLGAADYEADDVIATVARHSSIPTTVVTGDRDLFQIVDDQRGIDVCYLRTGPGGHDRVDQAWVVQRYGITPAQYADFAVLRGDPSDGLPGVSGIGEKTAASLLSAHGDLAGVLAAAAAGELPARVSSALAASMDYLTAAGVVARVDTGVPLPKVELRWPPSFDAKKFSEFGEQWNLGGSGTRISEVWQPAHTQARNT